MDWLQLGRRIKRITRISGKSQGEIIEEIVANGGRASRGAIGNWQRGDEHPTTTNLELFANATGSELVIDFIHPAETRASFTASQEAVASARVIDSLPQRDRERVLRFLNCATDLDGQVWAMLENVFDGIEARRVAAQRGEEQRSTHP